MLSTISVNIGLLSPRLPKREIFSKKLCFCVGVTLHWTELLQCFERNKRDWFQRVNECKQLEGTYKNLIIKLGTSYGAKFQEEAAVAKYFTQAQDQLTSQLPVEPDTTAASFDGLWNTREWSIKDAIVDVYFKETRKVIDVVILISDCPHCKKDEGKAVITWNRIYGWF